MDLALEGRDKGDPVSIRTLKWSLGRTYVPAIFGLSRSIKFRWMRDQPRLFPPAPSPWIPGSKIVRVQGKKIRNPNNSLEQRQVGLWSPPLDIRNLPLFIQHRVQGRVALDDIQENFLDHFWSPWTRTISLKGLQTIGAEQLALSMWSFGLCMTCTQRRKPLDTTRCTAENWSCHWRNS